LPFDQHELLALIAPRKVYVSSAEKDLWADPKGEYLSAYHAGPVYKLYGLSTLESDRMPAIHQPVMEDIGYHIRAGEHDVTLYDWERFLDFADKHFKRNQHLSVQEPSFSVKQGVNISHWLSQSNQRGENRKRYFTRDDVKDLAGFGFDHLRIPVEEEQMFLESGEKDAEAFTLLHDAIGWCKEFGLKTLVDLHILRSHHFNAADKPLFTQKEAQEQFYNCWKLLSGELKKYPNDQVAYELMNEPVADDHEVWNVIVNRCIETVRQLEPKRTIYVGSNRWQSFSTVEHLRLPPGDKNIVISFHYYEPFGLTHYKASWTNMQKYTGPVHYPGLVAKPEDIAGQPEDVQKEFRYLTKQVYDREKMASDFQKVADVAKKWGLTVYCGEFGCILAAPVEDRNRWYHDMGSLFRQFGFGHATWDFKGGFGVKREGQWVKEIIDPLTKPMRFGDG
jgi:endoglucanase